MLTFVSPTLMNRSLPSMDQALDTLSLSHRLCNSVKFCRVRSSAMRYLVIPNSATSAAEGFGMASFLFLSTTFLMRFEIKRRIIGDKAQDYRFRLCGLRWGVSCTSPHLKFVPIFKEHCTMPAQSRCHPLPLPGLIGLMILSNDFFIAALSLPSFLSSSHSFRCPGSGLGTKRHETARSCRHRREVGAKLGAETKHVKYFFFFYII